MIILKCLSLWSNFVRGKSIFFLIADWKEMCVWTLFTKGVKSIDICQFNCSSSNILSISAEALTRWESEAERGNVFTLPSSWQAMGPWLTYSQSLASTREVEPGENDRGVESVRGYLQQLWWSQESSHEQVSVEEQQRHSKRCYLGYDLSSAFPPCFMLETGMPVCCSVLWAT